MKLLSIFFELFMLNACSISKALATPMPFSLKMAYWQKTRSQSVFANFKITERLPRLAVFLATLNRISKTILIFKMR